MNFNYLNFQQTDQIKPLIDTTNSFAGKKDYTTNKTANDFATKQAEQNKTQNTGNRDSFAALMNKINEKNHAAESRTSSVSTSAAPEKKAESSFHTQAAKTQSETSTESTLLDIAALNAKITQILAAQSAEKPETDTDKVEEADTDGLLVVKTDEEQEDTLSPLLKAMSLLQDKIQQRITELSEAKTAERPKEAEEQLSLLQTISDSLRDILDSDENFTLLSNKTPEQLAKIQNFVAELLSREIDERDEDLIQALAAELSDLAPPLKEPRKTATLDTNNKVAETKSVLSPELSKPQDTFNTANYTKERYDARYSVEGRIDARQQSNGTQDGSFRQAVTDTAAKAAGKTDTPAAQQANNASAQGAGERFLQNGGDLGALFTTQGDISALGSAPQIGINQANATLNNIATNPVTQASHASQAHPATQAVMINIQKGLKAGNENTNIKIQLDPPELGRVEVKMSIGKDNASKIVLTVEKPETYALLQRDSHLLHQALQDSGLTSGNDLSFELASEQHEFFAGQGKDSSPSNGKGSNNKDSNGDIIETTMDLRVDPDTGQLRYNILV